MCIIFQISHSINIMHQTFVLHTELILQYSTKKVTFSKQGRILSDILINIARIWLSSISASIRDKPLMASRVMSSSKSSLSSMPAIMADSTVVEYFWTWGGDTCHYSHVTRASWHIKTPATPLFVQQLTLANNKGSIKAVRYWLFVRGIHQWLVVPLT